MIVLVSAVNKYSLFRAPGSGHLFLLSIFQDKEYKRAGYGCNRKDSRPGIGLEFSGLGWKTF